MKDNFDDIKDLFDRDGLNLPSGLFKGKIIKKLAAEQNNTHKKKSNAKIKRISAAAAVFAVVTAAALAVALGGGGSEPSIQQDVPAMPPLTEVSQTQNQTAEEYKAPEDKNLTLFKSNEEAEAYLEQLAKRLPEYSDKNGSMLFGGNKNDAMQAPPASAPGDDVNVNSADRSQTNTQTEGVDEADIIKNDGRYFYIAHSDSRLVVIDSQTMQTAFDGRISAHEGGRDPALSDLFISGDRLIALGTQTRDDRSRGSFSETAVFVMDISDPADVKQLYSFSQDGDYECARMIGDTVYTVSCSYNPFWYRDKNNGRDLMPRVFGQNAQCDRIFVRNDEKDPESFVIVTAFNFKNLQASPSYSCVLGSGRTVYCSQNRLYAAGTDFYDEKSETLIYSFELADGGVKYLASAKIDGTVESQYDMDEFGGYLRVAATVRDYRKGKDSCNLYVLDKKLSEVGRLEDIAGNEQIKSARFLGEMAYVVTFRNTDPLFSIDLGDPKNPKINGFVKLPGFSEYLHPMPDGTLLGVGYCGDERNVDFSDVKLTLFDVSGKEPKVLDEVAVKDRRCLAVKDPRAFVFDSRDGSFMLPFMQDISPSNSVEVYSFRKYAVQGGKLVLKAVFTPESSYAGFFRGAFNGGKFFTVTDYTVTEFDLESGEKERELRYSDSGRASYPYYPGGMKIYNGMMID